MKKLSLDLDQLAVDSFDTVGDAARNAGTVRGQGYTDTTCGQVVCDCPTGSGNSCQPDMCDTAGCGTADCSAGIRCPTGNMHTCQQPSCFYSSPCACV